MISTVDSKLNVVEIDDESLIVSGEESRSGMCRPNTRSLPSARTHSAATQLESMPPDSATITPRRLSTWPTMRRISTLMRSASASRSMERTAVEKAPEAMSGPLLAHDEGRDVGDGIEVLRD